MLKEEEVGEEGVWEAGNKKEEGITRNIGKEYDVKLTNLYVLLY